MTDDIVTRLRNEHAYSDDVGDFDIAKLVADAADEIERLRYNLENVRDLNNSLMKELQTYYD